MALFNGRRAADLRYAFRLKPESRLREIPYNHASLGQSMMRALEPIAQFHEASRNMEASESNA